MLSRLVKPRALHDPQTAAIALGVVGAVYWTARTDFVFFDLSAELIGVISTILIVVTGNRFYKYSRGDFIRFVSLGYIFVAGLGMLHIQSEANTVSLAFADQPVQLWLAGRYVNALVLFAAPFFMSRPLNTQAAIFIFSVISAGLAASILWLRIFPSSFVEGQGWTSFAVVSGAMLALILLGAAVHISRHRALLDPLAYRLIMLSIGTLILAEASFALFAAGYLPSNPLRHVLQVIASLFLAEGFIRSGVDVPYKQIVDHSQYLEEMVRERTKELEDANRDLRRQIDEREHAEQLQKASEERFRMLAENAQDLIYRYEIRPQGRYSYVSPASTRVIGYTPEECYGDAAITDKIIHPDDLPMMRAAAAPIPSTIAFRIRHKDGTLRWLELRSAPVCDDQGGVAALEGVVRDITARVEAANALRSANDTLSAIVKSSPVAITLLDPQLVIRLWNPAAERLFGWRSDEVLGKPLPIVPEEEWDIAVQTQRRVMAGEPVSDWERRRRCKDGTLLRVSVSAAPISDAEGHPIGTVALYSDVTDRRRVEEERERSLRNLRGAMEGTIQVVASAVEMRDRYIGGHQKRVSELAVRIGKEMALPEEWIDGIRLAGIVHDIGKIGIPSEILSKPGQLNKIELQLVEMHSQAGYDLLKDVKFPWPIAEHVLQHHERLDGSGYPQGLRAEDISIGARILAVADVVEAMATHRPYRPALGIDKAVEEIVQHRGSKYDSAVVDACVEVLGREGATSETL